jgi:hypothetical protein
VFGVAGVMIQAASLLDLSVPLAMIQDSGAVTALGEGQRPAVFDLAGGLFDTGVGFALLVFAGLVCASAS